MNNLDAPMTSRGWLLIALIFVSLALALSDIDEHLSNRVSPPVVLNSLPATKIKCRPGAIEGWCAKGYTVKQYEAMQNDPN